MQYLLGNPSKDAYLKEKFHYSSEINLIYKNNKKVWLVAIVIESVYNVFSDSHSRKKIKIFLISFLQESRKTTGPLYLYLNLHQTIFIWNHCLENFLQGGKHYNLFLSAFCFKLIFTRLFLTLSCYFPEGRVEILVFLSTVEYNFLENLGEVLLFFLEISFLCFTGPSCHKTVCN